MKKLIALAAVFVLLLGLFAGCNTVPAKEPAESEPTETEAVTPPPKPTRATEPDDTEEIVGVWNYAMDVGEIYSLMFDSAVIPEQQASMLAALSLLFRDVSVITVMEFREDHTYSIHADEDSAKTAIEKMKENARENLLEIISGFYGMTVEDLEAQMAESGKTMEEVLEAFDAEFNMDSLLPQVSMSYESGTFTYAEGRLVLTDREDNQVVYTIEVGDDQLRITDIEGVSGDLPDAMLPMVLVRGE